MKPEDIEEGMKYCPKCDQVHPMRNFDNRESGKDGKRSHCKECSKATESHRLSVGRQAQRKYAKGNVPPWAKL